MDIITVPASITLESSNLNRKYKWKSDSKKESVYHIKCKRALLRFTCKNFAYKLSKLDKQKRKVSLNFVDSDNLIIKRDKNGRVSLQGHIGNHPVVQISANKFLPKELKEAYGEKTKTVPINIKFNLNEWQDLSIVPGDFIIEIEQQPKALMKEALNCGFSVDKVARGRMYDLQLITPRNKEIVIAISSHVAKNENRSREKRIQKILMDISKMFVYVYDHPKTIPVIISRPIESDTSWSYTTRKYIQFYKEKFGFILLTTDFKKGWEQNIIKELLKI